MKYMREIMFFLLNLVLFGLTFYAGYLYLETGKTGYILAAVANFLALKLGLMAIGAFYKKKKKDTESTNPES